jgi:TRAP-type transport system periplasmic protein
VPSLILAASRKQTRPRNYYVQADSPHFAAGVLALPAVVRADEPIRLRCSLDTAPTHGRNVAVGDYLKKLEAASNGRIKPELFASGQLFADLNVTKALLQGQVDMAAPGAWAVTNFVQDADVFQLPALYDQPIEIIHRVIDGRAGAFIGSQLEQKVRSRVLGPWIDNGFSNSFLEHDTRRAI